MYWPRTTSSQQRLSVAANTLAFSSCRKSASGPTGGSIASRAMTCSRWFCTTSRSVPTES